MDQIFKCYMGIFLLLFLTYTQAGIITAGGQVVAARNHYCRYVQQLEASGCSEGEALKLIAEAKEQGYNLTIVVDADVNLGDNGEEKDEILRYSGRISMDYQVTIPFLGVDKREKLQGSVR